MASYCKGATLETISFTKFVLSRISKKKKTNIFSIAIINGNLQLISAEHKINLLA